jgi:hypothetical protein
MRTHRDVAALVDRVDTAYRTSYEKKNDPDKNDPILRDHHRLLWSKRLPDGRMFDLTANNSKPYRLSHRSDMGNFSFSSDAITHSYSRGSHGKKVSEAVRRIPKDDIDAFFNLGCTIGGYLIFPSNTVDKKKTITRERGTNPQIKDRFDLTLECIRRWYLGKGEKNPLYDCLTRYTDFFRLFTDFKGYVEFFLLDDIVDPKAEKISFWLPFEEFGVTHPFPGDDREYKEYMRNVSDFINARNLRMDKWSKARP